MDTAQTSVGSLKPGRYIVIEGKPYVVKNVQTSRTGKHGHAKCRIEAVNIFDGNKVIKVMPAHDNVDTPIIDKKNAQILSVTGNTANVMDMETYETFDLEISEELQGKVEEGSKVMYWTVLGKKIMKQK